MIEIISESIRHYRLLKGWNQKELGERLGLSSGAINKYEVGQVMPTAKKMDELIKLLNMHTIRHFEKDEWKKVRKQRLHKP